MQVALLDALGEVLYAEHHGLVEVPPYEQLSSLDKDIWRRQAQDQISAIEGLGYRLVPAEFLVRLNKIVGSVEEAGRLIINED